MTFPNSSDGTDLVQPVSIRVVNPATGELISLDAPTDQLGRFLADIREFEGRIKDMKSAVNHELLDRMQKRAKWTINVPGMKLTAPSPKPQEVWDGADLRQALLKFVDEGVLTIEAVDDAVGQEIKFVVKKAGVNSLRNLGGDIRSVIESLKTETEKPRYVSVTQL